MYDKQDNQKIVKINAKVLCIKDNPSLDMDDKKITIKRGQSGLVSYVGWHGEVHFKWNNGKETHEISNADLSEYVVLI